MNKKFWAEINLEKSENILTEIPQEHFYAGYYFEIYF